MSSSPHFRPNMSLYIPSVTASTTEEQIARVFKSLNIGVVSRVDFVDKDKETELGAVQRMAFIHFDFWYINNTSYHLQERIIDHGQGKIVYNDPYYWIVMENKTPRSKTEVELEKQVAALQSRIVYLEKILSLHSKKFVDNSISTKSYPCPDCLVDIPNDETQCDVCDFGSVKDEDANIELDNTMTVNSSGSIIYSGEEYDSTALAMTGALGMTGNEKELESLKKKSEEHLRSINRERESSTETPKESTSGWWPW